MRSETALGLQRGDLLSVQRKLFPYTAGHLCTFLFVCTFTFNTLHPRKFTNWQDSNLLLRLVYWYIFMSPQKKQNFKLLKNKFNKNIMHLYNNNDFTLVINTIPNSLQKCHKLM